MDEQRRSDEFLLVLVLLAVGKALLTRWLMLGPSDPFVTFAMEIAVIVLVLCTADLLPRRRLVWLDLAVYLAMVAIMYGNLLYANYFNELADPSMLQMAGQVGSVGDSVWALVSPIHLLYLVDVPFLLASAADMESFSTPRPGRSRTVAIAALVAFGVTAIQVGVVARMPAADGFAVARARGLGAYQVANILRGREASAVDAPPPDESLAGKSPGAVMQARIEVLRRGESPIRIEGVDSGAYAGKNVFVIQVESFQAMAFGQSFEGQQITPNINAMAADSWVCSRAFAQTGAGNTSDAEFISNSGLLPPPGKAAAVAYAEKEFPAIPRLLSEAGYRTLTMHANSAEFWNRVELYPALGFDTYYDQTSIGEEDLLWRGSSDEAFFEKAQELLSEELSYGRPIYAQLVTLSSHGPYKGVPEDRRPVQLSDALEDSMAGRWIGSLSYADKAVGQFLDWLRDEGLYEDSIVIVYGDHKALQSLDLEGADDAIVSQLLGRQYSIVDRQHIPLLIHLPGQKAGGVIDSTVGQIDIAPTVADLLGVSLDEVPHLGRSVFVDSDPFVMMRSYFPGGTVLNDRVAYLPGLVAEDGAAVRLDDAAQATPTEVDLADMKRGAALSALSEQWVATLPERSGADGTVEGYIPVSAQRPATPPAKDADAEKK